MIRWGSKLTTSAWALDIILDNQVMLLLHFHKVLMLQVASKVQ